MTIFRNAACAAAAALFATLANSAAQAGEASEQLSAGSALIVGSPIGSLVGTANGASDGAAMAAIGGYFVVDSAVQLSAQTVEVVFKSASAGVQFSARFGADAAGASAFAVGKGVEAVSTAAGTTLTASGRVLAFIPNAVGAALFSQKRLGAQ